jgi:drug/metabolite transporter (DMT)-like permease
VVLLLISAVMWGLTWWPLKAFNAAGIDGVPLILSSYGVVGIALSWLIAREWRHWQGKRYFLLLFFLLGGYANLAFATSMIYGDVVRAMMLFYLGPVWGVLGGRLFLGERIDLQRWLGVLFAMLGAWLILGGAAIFDTVPSAIDLLALTAGMAFALNNITFRATPTHPTGSKVAAMFIGFGNGLAGGGHADALLGCLGGAVRLRPALVTGGDRDDAVVGNAHGGGARFDTADQRTAGGGGLCHPAGRRDVKRNRDGGRCPDSGIRSAGGVATSA